MEISLRTIFLIQLGFVVFNIINAFHDSERIKKNKPIRHAYFGGIYLAAIVIICIVIRNWYAAPPLLFLRQLTFDPFLNVLRKLPVHYIPKNPKSILDQVENKIFGENWNAKAATYIILFIVTEVVLIISYA